MLLGRAGALARSLEPEVLAWRPEGLGFGSLGAQFRHVVAFYACFLRGLGGRRVDYDDRVRELAWEHDPLAVAKEVERIAEAMGAVEAFDEDEELEVLMDEPGAATTGWTRSSLGRELRFLASHAVHHLALVELMLQAQGCDAQRVAPGIGIAPSTPEKPGGKEGR